MYCTLVFLPRITCYSMYIMCLDSVTLVIVDMQGSASEILLGNILN